MNPSPGVTFENYNKTLCIPSVTEDDDGDYQCIARNEHGSIHHTYTVNVEGISIHNFNLVGPDRIKMGKIWSSQTGE